MKEYLDKTIIEQRFAESSATYDKYAMAQHSAASYLVELLKNKSNRSLQRVLEIGCGTGLLTKRLVDSFEIEQLFLNDLAQTLCESTANSVKDRVRNMDVLWGDAEKITVPDKIDMCVSASTLQWLCDLDAFVQKIGTVLTSGGTLAIALYGAGTMDEIKELTGRGLHYHTLLGLQNMVQKSFHIEYAEEVCEKYYFSSVWAVLKHIKDTGVGAVQGKQWSVGRLRQFEKDYKTQYGCELGIPVTFTTMYLVATKK